MSTPLILVNFGGPRSLEEVEEFLYALLADKDVIRSSLPSFIHRRFFARIARKRAAKVTKDYEKIGGKSPIYEDTEALAALLRTQRPVITFHRYIPKTHEESLQKMEELEGKAIVFPLFPQFSYTTTGSIARFFKTHFSRPDNLLWIKSYASHSAYVQAMVTVLKEHFSMHALAEEKVCLLFSAHGLPQAFVDEGDEYEKECQLSFQAIARAFPCTLSYLCYQSKFGRGQWLQPATEEACLRFSFGERENVVVVPLSFTSDHIETLFEIEELYLPILRARGFKASRCLTLHLHPAWVSAIESILENPSFTLGNKLIRPLA